jgi:hypothetical protein
VQNFSSIVYVSNEKVWHHEHRKKYTHAKHRIEHNCGNSLIELNVHRLHVQVVVGKYILRINYFAFSLEQQLEVELGLVVEARSTLQLDEYVQLVHHRKRRQQEK